MSVGEVKNNISIVRSRWFEENWYIAALRSISSGPEGKQSKGTVNSILKTVLREMRMTDFLLSPLRHDRSTLGDTSQEAITRLEQLESKLKHQPLRT